MRDEARKGREGSVGVSTHRKVHQMPKDSLGIRQLTSRNAGSRVMASRARISSISFLSFTAIILGKLFRLCRAPREPQRRECARPLPEMRMWDRHFKGIGERHKVLLTKPTPPHPRGLLSKRLKGKNSRGFLK